MIFTEMKTGKTQGLFAFSLQHNAGMQVAAETIIVFNGSMALNVMGKRKLAAGKGRLKGIYARSPVPCFGQYVVIALYQ